MGCKRNYELAELITLVADGRGGFLGMKKSHSECLLLEGTPLSWLPKSPFTRNQRIFASTWHSSHESWTYATHRMLVARPNSVQISLSTNR